MEQQPGIDKKAIAAILLCAVIWAVWMNTNYRRTQQLAAQKMKAQQELAATTGTSGALAMSGTTAGAIAVATPAAATTSTPTLEAPVKTVPLANKVVAIELSSAGARPVDADVIELETAKDELEKEAEHVLAGLVAPSIPGAKVAALAPWFGDAEASRIPADARFETISASDTEVVFRLTLPDGLELTRTWRASKSEPTLRLIETYANKGAAAITGRPGIVWAAPDKKGKTIHDTGMFEPGAGVNDRFQYKTPKNEADERRTYSGPVDFIAIHDRYYTGAIAPVEPRFDSKDSVRFRRPTDEALMVLALAGPMTLGPGETRALTHDVYLGPKDYSVLRSLGHNLGWVMNWGERTGIFWGLIGLITKGLWYALRWFHDILGSWGLAIIALTFVMRGLLWPLAARQMRMANEFAMKSQKIKPQIDKLREKYAADPMAMNRETMQLYKQHGISPFSPLAGCLPLFLQLPIWWALYRVLWTAIELRGQPFLYLHDLSMPEKLFAIGGFDIRLLPILLGAVTWLQMKLTPQAGTDPVQQKMMLWMMPTMFTFFMWSLPAGLVVYIFTSTLMGIVQQWMLKRAMSKGTEAPQGGVTEATR